MGHLRVLRRLGAVVQKRGYAQALTTLSKDDSDFKNFVRDFAMREVSPKVKQMETEGKFDKGLVEKLFDNGLMGLEIPRKYDGMEMNFFRTIISIEELSKVDPALAIMADIQNTLINALIMKLGTEEQKLHYLPKLAKFMVSIYSVKAGNLHNVLIM